MDNIPFGKQMFPEPVRTKFKEFSEYDNCIAVRSLMSDTITTVLCEIDVETITFAHPAVKALVETAKEIEFVLRGNDLYVSAKKLTKVLAPFEEHAKREPNGQR